jgi:hypothetical protein
MLLGKERDLLRLLLLRAKTVTVLRQAASCTPLSSPK